MTVSLGYKGSGSPNGIPAYNDDGAWMLGGVHSDADTGNTPKFGCVVSVDPDATQDGIVYMGIPSGYAPVGIIVYNGGIAETMPAKNDAYLSLQPLTWMYKGQMWLYSWEKTQVGAIDPIVGCVVQCNNTTGAIEFLPYGSAASTGWTIISASVKSLTISGDGVMLFLNF